MSSTLTAAGWTRLASGRWKHPELFRDGRPRLFTEGDALELVALSDAVADVVAKEQAHG